MLLTSHGGWGQWLTTSPLKAQWHQDRWKMSPNFFPFSKIIWLLARSELFLCTGLQQCLRQQGVLKTGATRILLRDHLHLYHDHPGCYIIVLLSVLIGTRSSDLKHNSCSLWECYSTVWWPWGTSWPPPSSGSLAPRGNSTLTNSWTSTGWRWQNNFSGSFNLSFEGDQRDPRYCGTT